jgi:heme-degrading monooxygenase HmoA
MYVSMSRLRVAIDRADEVVAAFGHRGGLVESHGGSPDLEIWRSDRDPAGVVMVSRWRDRDASTAYVKSTDHWVSHEWMSASLKAVMRLERLESMHTRGVVAE